MSIYDYIFFMVALFIIYSILCLEFSPRTLFKSSYFDIYTTSLIFEVLHIALSLLSNIILSGDVPAIMHSFFIHINMLIENLSTAILLAHFVLSVNRYTAVAHFYIYRAWWTGTVVCVIKILLWLTVLLSHLYILWAQLVYDQGFLIGYTRTIQQINRFYQIGLMVFIGIPSLFLDILSIKHLRQMNHEFKFLAWHNALVNATNLPFCVYQIFYLLENMFRCVVCHEITRSLRYSEMFCRHSSLFVMVAFSRDVRRELLLWRYRDKRKVHVGVGGQVSWIQVKDASEEEGKESEDEQRSQRTTSL